MENIISRLERGIPTDRQEDVLLGLIMSYYGWDGKCITNAERRLYAAQVALRRAGISKELLIELNDSGASFDDIANYLDKNYGLASSNR
jgi:hypothetical protein